VHALPPGKKRGAKTNDTLSFGERVMAGRRVWEGELVYNRRKREGGKGTECIRLGERGQGQKQLSLAEKRGSSKKVGKTLVRGEGTAQQNQYPVLPGQKKVSQKNNTSKEGDGGRDMGGKRESQNEGGFLRKQGAR